MTESAESAVYESVATIDNGSFGTLTIRFETGRLAKQAAGSVVAASEAGLSAWTSVALSSMVGGRRPGLPSGSLVMRSSKRVR